MNFLDLLFDGTTAGAREARIYGVVVGVVTNNQDPEKLGRVKVKFPWLSDEDESNWARVAVADGRRRRGFYLPARGGRRGAGRLRARRPALPLRPRRAVERQGRAARRQRRRQEQRPRHQVAQRPRHPPRRTRTARRRSRSSTRARRTASSSTPRRTRITITADKDIVLERAARGDQARRARSSNSKSSADAKVEAGAGMDLKASGAMKVKGATVDIN